MPKNYRYVLSTDTTTDVANFVEKTLFGQILMSPDTEQYISMALQRVNMFFGTIDPTNNYLLPEALVESVIKPLATSLTFEAGNLKAALSESYGDELQTRSIREGNTTINYQVPKNIIDNWKTLIGYSANINDYAPFLKKFYRLGTVGQISIILETEAGD